ncbi:protein LEO1 homolog isoform X2 [Olea europaea var. sylvestris]|uniref:protein LEO1 homolog isoform X2 n=1 Tax=Olea europaea var. sylvestris TaxID=158386 RepID=UPI000C1D077D|nr:protein LEO1 homolog isoform X2 [Olea europaea var. sylvestris]
MPRDVLIASRRKNTSIFDNTWLIPKFFMESNYNEEYGVLEPEVEGKAVQESENEPEALDRIHAESREKIQCSQEICIHDQSGGSKSLGSTKDDKQQCLAALFHDISGDSDNGEHDSIKDDKQRGICDIFGDSDNEENGGTKDDKQHSAAVNRDIFRDSDNQEHDSTKYDKHHLAVGTHDIFGDCDNGEQADHITQNQNDDNRYRLDEGNYVKERRPEVRVPDEDVLYEYADTEQKEKATASSLALEIPQCCPLADPDKMYVLKLSNLVAIDPKPFDPSTYVEQDFFGTDNSGHKRHIPPQNIIRWRTVKKPDGRTSVESNARLVTWEDGSLQLLIGEQAFMVSELDTRENQAHLFQRHKNGILQSQGRISKKLQFLPASDSQFSAILDATRNKNVKVKSCTADVISQWELENKKKMEKQTYRPNKRLGQMGKGIHKCGQIVSQEHRVPPGLLKDLMDYEQDFREQQSAAQHLNENRENEAGASVITFNGKKGPKSPLKLPFPDAKSSQGPEDLLGSRKMVDKIRGKTMVVRHHMEGLRRQSRNEEETYEDSEVEAELSNIFSK